MAPKRTFRVVLVEPPINPITCRFGLPIIANYPPLAQARLAGQIDGGGVEIADLRFPGERSRLLASLAADPPALVGISVTFTSNGDEAIEIASAIRRAAPRVPIVLGGTAPSEDPASFYDSSADLIGMRGGDETLSALVREVRRAGRLPRRFPGFFHRDAGRWVLDPAPGTSSLASLRPCAWHLIPRRYWRRYYQGMRPTGMGQTSEGCPYDCTFCSVWITHGRKVTLASLENVQHDLRSLPASVRGFFFADDIWMQASEAQIRELYDPLLEWITSEFLPKRGDFRLTAETRTDLYLRQEERFKAWIRRGHLRWIFFGVEAVTDEQLRGFSKRNTVDANSEALRRASEAGAFVTAQFVIPCEAKRSYFDEIVRFVRQHRRWIRAANFTIATPLPGTELYRETLATVPDLADRRAVSHPGFSLFTALMPTRLEPREFYEQVARVYREANQARFSGEIVRQGIKTLCYSPWLVPRLMRMPGGLRALTNPETFLESHRQVQGERLLEPRSHERPTALSA
ncbi:MAG TPA: radical SAM protein [Candidatus Polarisedimenticolia bacterium]|nr:radical SAM protein [Candidatus Polarisedimenticolia bacterium]